MKIYAVLGIAFLFVCTLPESGYTLNLGGSGASGQADSEEESQVQVSNLPIQTLTKKINGEDTEVPYVRVMGADYFILEIAKEITLGNDEPFESEQFDVREYKEASFYVIPDQILGDASAAIYQLDAFFAVTSVTQKIQTMGGMTKNIINGWQEFGSMTVNKQDELPQPSFVRLSTGETTNRVLTTKIYGPFVHVVLRNLTPDVKRKFKIVAYLTR